MSKQPNELYRNKLHLITNWTNFLPFATFADNKAVHDNLEMSLFIILFLREPTRPVDLTFPTFPLSPVAAKFYYQMENMKVAVQARIEDQQDYSMNHHNKFRREATYDHGNLVLLNPSNETGFAKEFTYPYRGPFRAYNKPYP